MESKTTRVFLIFLTALFPLSPWSLGASAVDVCKCELLSFPQVTGGPIADPECVPASLQIDFNSSGWQDGACWTPLSAQCLSPKDCQVKVEVMISGTAPCRIYVKKNGGLLGGGNLWSGGNFSVIGHSIIECGTFDQYTVLYGPSQSTLTTKNFACFNCQAGPW
ncbi:MAG: hypothetical protein JNL28_08575 [Planctomycetes bacterium]|nr:hypothetical protein [Planctomycetota bacterium]